MSDPLLIERGPLLNFSGGGFWAPHLYKLELVYYRQVEYWFQAGKVMFIERDSNELKSELFESIAYASNCYAAKNAGRVLRPFDSFGWDEYAPRHMLEGLVYKFTQNPVALRHLLETGDRSLVEHRPDPIWGDNLDGTGRNLMGLALEHVREKLCR